MDVLIPIYMTEQGVSSAVGRHTPDRCAPATPTTTMTVPPIPDESHPATDAAGTRTGRTPATLPDAAGTAPPRHRWRSARPRSTACAGQAAPVPPGVGRAPHWTGRWSLGRPLGRELARAYQNLRLPTVTAGRTEPESLDPDPLILRRTVGYQPNPGHPQRHRPVRRQKTIGCIDRQHRAESYPNVKHRASSSPAPRCEAARCR